VFVMAMFVSLGRPTIIAMAFSGAVLAQSPAVPALSGAWSLNIEESSASSDVASTAPTPPAADPPPRPVGPGTPTDGAGRSVPWNDPTKTGSLLPSSVNNALNSSEPPKDKGRALTPREKLLLELTTPPTRLAVTATRDAVTVTREGRTDTYLASGKEEKHRCVNGSIVVKTYWTDGTLRQEINGGDTLKLIRTLQLDDHGRLIVIIRPADDKSVEFETRLVSKLGADASTKGRKRAVYDAEIR
jgi:hypothetical protein